MSQTIVAVAMAATFAACAGKQVAPVPNEVARSESQVTSSQQATASGDSKLETRDSQLPVGYEVGNAAPSFALSDTDGKTVSLADFAGKPLVLVFYRGQW